MSTTFRDKLGSAAVQGDLLGAAAELTGSISDRLREAGGKVHSG